MNLYIEKIKGYLDENEDITPVTKQLYRCYKESHRGDSAEISAEFDWLDEALRELRLRDYDKVWDISCNLCALHEMEAFEAGIQLTMELAGE